MLSIQQNRYEKRENRKGSKYSANAYKRFLHKAFQLFIHTKMHEDFKCPWQYSSIPYHVLDITTKLYITPLT